jgi:RNA polymerase sigma-70 factor (ECF subfamily)
LRYDEDLRIARAILDRDDAAFGQWWEVSYDRVYRFVLSRVEGVQEAEEITQETMVEVIGCLERYKGHSSLLTWVCGIARHKISDYYRSRQRSRNQLRIEELEQAVQQALEGTGPIDGVLAWLEEAEAIEALATTLDLLPPDHRQALVLKYHEGRTLKEIAVIMQRGTKAVESLLDRAKASFRELHRIQTGEVISLRRPRRLDGR